MKDLAGAAATPPELGWVSEGKVINIVDGDTVDVEVRRVFRIRLIDCWAPETRTTDLFEKELGLKAKERMTKLVFGQTVRFHIPQTVAGVMQDITTLGRFLGSIWLGSVNIAKQLVSENLVGSDKDGERKLLKR